MQNVARVVANATHRLSCVTLAPGGGVECVTELTLESQRDPGGRLGVAKPSLTNPVLWCSGFDGEFRQAATPDQRRIFLAQDREIAEPKPLIALERGPHICIRLLRRTWQASGPKTPRDFG